jgi:hypothetical protein
MKGGVEEVEPPHYQDNNIKGKEAHEYSTLHTHTHKQQQQQQKKTVKQ